MSQTIEVLVRVRPGSSSSNAGEITSNANPNNTNAVLVDEQAGKVCVPRLKNKGQAEFTFTKVFSPAANQQMVYSGMGDIVPHVLQGINCCCLTYGQTNTGKTYTMYGEGWDEINNAKESTKALIAAPNGKLLDITKGRDGDDNESVSSLNRDYDSDDDGSVVTIGNANQPVQQHNIESLGIVPRCIADLFEVLDSKCKSATGKTKFDYSVSKYCTLFAFYNALLDNPSFRFI